MLCMCIRACVRAFSIMNHGRMNETRDMFLIASQFISSLCGSFSSGRESTDTDKIFGFSFSLLSQYTSPQ
jgi:hypothetical protein